MASSPATSATASVSAGENPSSTARTRAARLASFTPRRSAIRMAATLAAPLPDGDDGPAARAAVDEHLVHQAPGAGQPHAHAVAGREALAHRQLQVGDARTF